MRSDLLSPENIDAGLRVLSWCLIVFAALWTVTSVLGYFHRRAYNLTRAESSRSKNIKPDFLKVDVGKREAAIGRGRAYDAVLDNRESGAAAPTDRLRFWSRFAAIATALVGLGLVIFGTVTKVDSLQAGVNRITSWDRFTDLISQNQAGSVVAVLVIVVNVYETATKLKSIPARR
jgi:uncharacterized membrane protein